MNTNNNIKQSKKSIEDKKVPLKSPDINKQNGGGLSFGKKSVKTNIDSQDDQIAKLQLQKVVTGKELLNLEITDLPWLVQKVFPKVALAAISGGSDTGKSAFLRQLTIAICTGEESFLGFELKAEHKRAIYVSTEDDLVSTSYLLNKQSKGTDNVDKLEGLRFMFDSENIIESLDAELKREPVDLVILDTPTDMFNIDLNSSTATRNMLSKFNDLARKHRCLIISLLHVTKASESGLASKNNIVGSQSLQAKMRVVIELKKDPNNSQNRLLYIVKGNYHSSAEKQSAVVLFFDSDLTFHNAGNLINASIRSEDLNFKKEQAIARAIELRAESKSIRETEDVFKTEGISYKRTAIGELLKEFDSRKTIDGAGGGSEGIIN